MSGVCFLSRADLSQFCTLKILSRAFLFSNWWSCEMVKDLTIDQRSLRKWWGSLKKNNTREDILDRGRKKCFTAGSGLKKAIYYLLIVWCFDWVCRGRCEVKQGWAAGVKTCQRQSGALNRFRRSWSVCLIYDCKQAAAKLFWLTWCCFKKYSCYRDWNNNFNEKIFFFGKGKNVMWIRKQTETQPSETSAFEGTDKTADAQ